MKTVINKIKRNAGLIVAVVLGVTSCQQNDEMGQLPDGKHPIIFTAAVNGPTVTNAATRATTDNTWTGCEKVAMQMDGAYSFALIMTHVMALVVIETPITKYTFNNTSPTIPDYNTSTPDAEFYGFTPYSPTVGTYRYLVKPVQNEAMSLHGSYTDQNDISKEYTITQDDIGAANYAHYKVDGGTTTTINKTHTLQVGDFYMSDGSLLGKDVALTNAQKATCLGIVLKVGKDDDRDWKDNCKYKLKDGTTPMPTIHGYVLALYDANDSNYCNWGSFGTNVETNTESNTGFYGYTNTNKIKQYAKANSKTLVSDFPATYHATEGYKLSHQAPAITSGWFLPSAGQCQYWLNSSTVLLASIKKAISNDKYQWKSWYWSSSEKSDYPEYNAWYLGFNGNVMNGARKDDNGFVRSVLAF